MTESQTPNKLTRRQALKTLAAIVGAGTLTALPIQWGKPGLRTGVLPVFAQTTGGTQPRTLETVSVPDEQSNLCQFPASFTVGIVPPAAGIQIRFRVFSIEIDGPSFLEDEQVAPTDINGEVTFIWDGPDNFLDLYEVEFSFANPADGIGEIYLEYGAPC